MLFISIVKKQNIFFFIKTHKNPRWARVSQTMVIIWKGLFKALSLTFNSGSP